MGVYTEVAVHLPWIEDNIRDAMEEYKNLGWSRRFGGADVSGVGGERNTDPMRIIVSTQGETQPEKPEFTTEKTTRQEQTENSTPTPKGNSVSRKSQP